MINNTIRKLQPLNKNFNLITFKIPLIDFSRASFIQQLKMEIPHRKDTSISEIDYILRSKTNRINSFILFYLEFVWCPCICF